MIVQLFVRIPPLMENTYGYKPLSYELIKLFRSGAPDFAKAEELIRPWAIVACRLLSIQWFSFSLIFLYGFDIMN